MPWDSRARTSSLISADHGLSAGHPPSGSIHGGGGYQRDDTFQLPSNPMHRHGTGHARPRPAERARGMPP